MIDDVIDGTGEFSMSILEVNGELECFSHWVVGER